MSLLQISKAMFLVALFLFVRAHSLQRARENFPAFPSRAPCTTRITSLYTASCQTVAAVLARGSGVRLSNHACRLFEGLVVVSRSNAKSAFACARRHFLRSCKIMFFRQLSLFLIAGHKYQVAIQGEQNQNTKLFVIYSCHPLF